MTTDRPAALDGLLGYVADNIPNQQPAPPIDRALLAGLLAFHADQLATTFRTYAAAGLPEHKPGAGQAAELLDLHKRQLLAGRWTDDVQQMLTVMLDNLADEVPAVSSAVAQSAPAETALVEGPQTVTHNANTPAARQDQADLHAENAKLIRWHREDGDALAEMRATIVRLRDELKQQPAAAPAVSSVGQAAHTARDAAEHLARVHEWVTGEVVTATTEFGNGYRAAQRDIRDLIKGRFDNDAANELRRMADETQPAEAWDVPDARPGTTDHTLTQPVQHAPGIAILCADCRAKGHTVCMDDAVSQPGKEH